jgi:hypothetical protein
VICTAWDWQDTRNETPPTSVLTSPDALRAISMLLLVPTICPQDFTQKTQAVQRA